MASQEMLLGEDDGPDIFREPPKRVDWDKTEIKVLDASEYGLLADIEPFDRVGIPTPNNASAIVAAISRGEVVAYWSVFLAVHVEPMWIKEEHRNRPGLIRRLWNGVLEVLRNFNVSHAFATIKYEDVLISLPSALRLGFKRYGGDLYTIKVDEANNLGGIPEAEVIKDATR